MAASVAAQVAVNVVVVRAENVSGVVNDGESGSKPGAIPSVLAHAESKKITVVVKKYFSLIYFNDQ